MTLKRIVAVIITLAAMLVVSTGHYFEGFSNIWITISSLVVGAGALYWGFNTGKQPARKQVDPRIASVAKKMLQTILDSMTKGRLVKEDGISPLFLQELKEKMASFGRILADQIEVRAEIQDMDKAHVSVAKENDQRLKVKVDGYFIQDYFHNGKMLETPGDKHSYITGNPKSEYGLHTYTLNFDKTSGELQLIGYTETLMGNRHGEL